MDYSAVVERFIVKDIMLKDEGTTISPSESLIGAGILDSLSLLRLVEFVGEELNVEILDHEVVPEHFDSIARINEFVEKKKAQNS